MRILVRGECSGARVVIRLDGEDEVRYPMTLQEKECETGDYAIYNCNVPLGDRGLYWYYFEVDSPDGTEHIGRSGPNNEAVSFADGETVLCWQQTVYRQDYPSVDWIYGGVYYHVFVDRFNHSGDYLYMQGKVTREDWGGTPEYLPVNGRVFNNDFFGGNLEGVREKLPYLESLGVTCIYLSPVVEAYSNHKYDTADYSKVDPMFGTMEDFRVLCEEARGRGIRVICDGVFSHTGSDSVYFNKYKHYGQGGAYNDPDSPYREWYTFHEDGSYDTWWGIDTLPCINKMVPSYREFINGHGGIAQYWLDNGASGWRLDVVDEFPSEFLSEFVAGAKSAKSDALILGEVWEDASIKEAYGERKNYFRGDRLDSVMNYPLKDAIIRFVRYGDARGLKEVVEDQWEHYPRYVMHGVMNILGTHDSVRILTALAGKELDFEAPRWEQAETFLSPEERATGLRRLKIAALLQMTLPGVPCIYYGDEAGMEGYKDPFNRRCYPWGEEDQDLLAWYRKLTAIRRSHAVYAEGGYRTIAESDGMYAFARYTPEPDGTAVPAGGAANGSPDAGHSEIVTAVNCGHTIKEVGLTGNYIDLITGRWHSGNTTVAPGEVLLLEKQ